MQKYYIAACFNPLDTRVPTLLVDADNEHGTYFRCRDVDPEIALLKAALRWACDNGIGESGWLSGMEPPPEFAPLIAEAVKERE